MRLLVMVTAAAMLFVPRPSLPAQETGPGSSPEQRAAERQALTAADSILEARTTRLASELRCPVCQGLAIQDSPSELAQQMRGLIKDQLKQGKSDQEVREYFLSKYGEWILLEPKASGFNLVAYIAPFLALLVGGGVVWLAVRRWTAAAPASAGGEPPSGPDAE